MKFVFAAIVVGGIVTYTEDLLLFEEDFEDSSHHQRLEGVVTICKQNLEKFDRGWKRLTEKLKKDL